MLSRADKCAIIVTEQDKLRNIRAEPSAEAKATKLKQDILKLTRQRLKIAKGYTVHLYVISSLREADIFPVCRN